MRIRLVAIAGLAAIAASVSAGEPPANTWVKLAEEISGARGWPAFWFEPQLGRFVLSGGVASTTQPHFDTETFDAKSGQWANAYPDGAPYKAESGRTDAPLAVISNNEPPVKPDSAGVARIQRRMDVYTRDPGMFFQYARSADDGRLYAYLLDATIRFDPKARQWADLRAARFSKCRDGWVAWLLYGSLAYDPVNREFMSVGGTSEEDGGTPGTWTYDIAANEWKKLSTGSAGLNALNAEARALHAHTAAFINACRNRFYLTESESEARQDFAAGANELAAAADKLAAALTAAKLAGPEANAPKVALAAMAKVSVGFKALASALNGAFTGDTLVEAQALQDALLAAERALDAEPCGRAVSQMATCPASGKIVLFGGCTMDGFLADTWVYDCKARTWEQRYPRISPAPRGGHTLTWLPKSGKVVLFGSERFTSGYGVPHQKPAAPRDLWAYDVELNEWKFLAGESKDGPAGGVGAVDGDDLLVFVSRDPKKADSRITWGLRVDPKAADAGSAEAGVLPATAALSFDGPSDFDKASKPDPEAVARFLEGLPPNQWTAMPAPPRKANPRSWSTRPYDTVRHQFLSFGGGHSPEHYTDVTHYSLRTATWSSGYAEEYPFVNASLVGFFKQTFWNRPVVGHLWKATSFDPVSGKVIYCRRGTTLVYDPAKREWEYPPLAPPNARTGALSAVLGPTPRGAVCWSNNGIQLFDAKAGTWSDLPLQGGKVGEPYGDDSGIFHDSKRDCLWLARNGSPMLRYDMKTGTVQTHSTPGVPVNIWMRESAYVPELDMLLNSGRVTGPDGAVGNLAYDIEKRKWVAVQMPCSDGKPRINAGTESWVDVGLDYDAGLKLAVFHSMERQILVARLGPAGLKTFEPRLQEPKKK